MSQYRDRAKQFHEGITHILLNEWDPIGVAGVPEAANEYDQYVNQIYGILIRQEPARTLYDYLWWAITENMGLRANCELTQRVVDRLLEMRDEINNP